MRREAIIRLTLSLLLLTLAACGKEDEPEPTPKPGEACQVSEGDAACEGDATCVDDGTGATVCKLPVGAACTVDAMTMMDHCAPDSACVEVAQEDGTTASVCRTSEGGACTPGEDTCDPSLVCAPVGAAHACHMPVRIEGTVRAAAGDAIVGAHIIGLDDQRVAVTDVSVSEEGGAFTLALPVERNEDGSPKVASYTLRASADGFQTFPGGLRTALPISTADVTKDDAGYVLKSTLTELVLLPIKDTASPRATISGQVTVAEHQAGVLVVAEADGKGYSALTDRSGHYTIFNVPDGAYTVRGYAADVQLTPADVNVSGEDLADVNLDGSADPLTTVTGSVQIVNAQQRVTSVVLVPVSTFEESFGRGEVPRGLRAPKTGDPSVEGSFSIEGVPQGKYVVLAAFENDGLVRDPDTNIAGTDFVYLDVTAMSPSPLALDSSFKITEALQVFGPGADTPEGVTSPPTLEWADDSSEDYYEVKVYNAYGDLVWEDLNVPAPNGDRVSIQYGGPMVKGMYYQFKATSFRKPNDPSPISTTEDLRGVFFVE